MNKIQTDNYAKLINVFTSKNWNFYKFKFNFHTIFLNFMNFQKVKWLNIEILK